MTERGVSDEDGGDEDEQVEPRESLNKAKQNVIDAANSWFHNRRLGIQIVFAALGSGMIFEAARRGLVYVSNNTDIISEEVTMIVSNNVPTISALQAILIFFGVYLYEAKQRRETLTSIQTELESMSPRAAADGGVVIDPAGDEDDSEESEESEEPEGINSSTLGGLIAGAAAGASFGPQGVFIGATVGVVIADEMSKRSDEKREQEARERHEA